MGEGFAFDGGVEFVDVFDAVETVVCWLLVGWLRVGWFHPVSSFVLPVGKFSKVFGIALVYIATSKQNQHICTGLFLLF